MIWNIIEIRCLFYRREAKKYLFISKHLKFFNVFYGNYNLIYAHISGVFLILRITGRKGEVERISHPDIYWIM